MKEKILKEKISIEVSARHIHISKKDLEKLFGKGYQFKKLRDLTQPGEFAATETLDIQVGSKKLKDLRIVGPLRRETLIELSQTDAFVLGLKPPIREMDDLKGTPGAVLIGPKGEIKIKRGIINNWRHIHCNFKEAKEFGLKDKILVSVKVNGIGSITFHNVKVRVEKRSRLCLHLDTDEGNAANITKKGEGIIL